MSLWHFGTSWLTLTVSLKRCESKKNWLRPTSVVTTSCHKHTITYHMTTAVVLWNHVLPLPQIILQQVADLPVGVAVSVVALMTNWVATPVCAVAAAVAVVMRHGYNSCGTLAVMAVGVLIPAALKCTTALLADVVCTSAGLNCVVQLEKK